MSYLGSRKNAKQPVSLAVQRMVNNNKSNIFHQDSTNTNRISSMLQNVCGAPCKIIITNKSINLSPILLKFGRMKGLVLSYVH